MCHAPPGAGAGAQPDENEGAGRRGAAGAAITQV